VHYNQHLSTLKLIPEKMLYKLERTAQCSLLSKISVVTPTLIIW